MEVTALSASLGFRSEQIDWYRDVKAGLYNPFLIDSLPGRDDRLRYSTAIRFFPPKLYIFQQLKQLKSLDDERTKCLYSSTAQISFPEMQKSFPSVLGKYLFFRLLCERIVSLCKEICTTKNTSLGKTSKQLYGFLLKKNSFESK